jgi:hypothetical protein
VEHSGTYHTVDLAIDRHQCKPVGIRRSDMAGKTLGEELRNEMAGKAIVWGPAIAGGMLLGPVGFVLGLATSVVLVASGNSSPAPSSEQGTGGCN